MGTKGDKNTQDSNLMVNLLLAKLEPIGGITSKRMFGGHGIFHDGKMFGMVDSKGNCYLKAGDANKATFEAKDWPKHSKMPYYAIPPEVIEDASTLSNWAESSIQVTK